MLSFSFDFPDLRKLADLKYLFENQPEPKIKYLGSLILFLVLAFLLTFIIHLIFRPKIKKIPLYRYPRNRLVNLFLTLGISGIFLLFFRFEAIPFLSMRFFWIILFLIIIIWLGFILFDLWRRLPKRVKEYKNKKILEQYLPKAKK